MTSETTPYLIVHNAQGNLHLPLVGRYYWTFGRSNDNTIVIPDRWISRNHIMLQSTENREFYLIDLGSRNGTFKNGRRVSIPETLKDDDRITIGKTELEFHLPKIERNTQHGRTRSEGDSLTSVLHVRCLMSVMVIDIRGYTVLARQLEESTLSCLIGSWFREAGKIIRNYGSWVDKYIGDALMAIWFHRQEQVAKEEVTEIFRAIYDLYQMTSDLSDQYPLPFKLRIGAGLNTGYAMVGNTGSGDRPDYTAIGDTVNAAFRLETATKQVGLDLVLGETTYQSLTAMPEIQAKFQKHTVNLKGYDNAQTIYGINFQDLEEILPQIPLAESLNPANSINSH